MIKETPSNRDLVLRKIARRNYASYELKQKLKEIPEIDAIVEEFVEKGYINDDDWMRNYIRSEEGKGKGPQAIAAKLRSKGFPRHKIEELFTLLSPDEALDVAIRKKSKGRVLEGKERQKLIASLFRLGFSWDAISRKLNTDLD